MEFEVKNQTKLKIKFVKVSKPLLQNHDLMSKTQEPKDLSLLASAEVCDYCDRIFHGHHGNQCCNLMVVW